MPTHRRISIGHAVCDETDNEWHQKIRDILDISPSQGSGDSTNGHVKMQKKGPIRRRTVCGDGMFVNESGIAKVVIGNKDESTASLSNYSSNEVSPTSPSRPDLSSMYREKWREMTPSPKKYGNHVCKPVLAKHRINSPRYCISNSAGRDPDRDLDIYFISRSSSHS